MSESQTKPTLPSHSRLVSLRNQTLIWMVPVVLLLVALIPWPYWYYNLLRLAVFAVSVWIAYEQWQNDDAFSGWVVAFGLIALLYNPFLPVHLTREIWSVLNVGTAALFLGHLVALKKLGTAQSNKL